MVSSGSGLGTRPAGPSLRRANRCQPEAFLGSDQWPSGAQRSPKDVAALISSWVSELPELGTSMVDGLLKALETAGNYVDAGATAERLVALGSMTDEQFERLDRAWWSNDQLHGGILPTRALEPFYKSNGRSWPPAKGRADGLSGSAAADAEPF